MRILACWALLSTLVTLLACGPPTHENDARTDAARETVRSWLAAVARRDSIALDSLSVPGDAFESARRLGFGTEENLSPHIDSTTAIIVSSTGADTAFAEFVIENYAFRDYGATVVLLDGGWRIASVSPFRRH